jgi:hypothetical protein
LGDKAKGDADGMIVGTDEGGKVTGEEVGEEVVFAATK